MKEMESMPVVREISQYTRQKVYGNVIRNENMVYYYKLMLVEGIIKKRMTEDERCRLRSKIQRLENCNRFWSVEVYPSSNVKILLRTFLCKDKFCSNCNQMKRFVFQNRFLPYMEQYKHSLYHMVLTVPVCKADELKDTIQRMIYCFKTLVTYLNGNKKVNGLDLLSYGFIGCVRSLEITYKGNVYHPHFHVAVVLENGETLENRHFSNQFSGKENRLFSDFEMLIQRIWWLLINQKRLTVDNICNGDNFEQRYSCVVDKFHPEDYEKLFGYMTKLYAENNALMTYQNFKTIYGALEHVRQIQGYGVFYNMKKMISETYTEQDYETLERYLTSSEQSISMYEPMSRIAGKSNYIVLKRKNLI